MKGDFDMTDVRIELFDEMVLAEETTGCAKDREKLLAGYAGITDKKKKKEDE